MSEMVARKFYPICTSTPECPCPNRGGGLYTGDALSHQERGFQSIAASEFAQLTPARMRYTLAKLQQRIDAALSQSTGRGE